MDLKNKRILEALQMQPLSQEEMTSRHILGRLYGPIATCIESTRNGRLYNKPLWEKALKDDIFLEKVATKALFLELGHPADREETDMKQACACIPEVPKIVGDDLYAYVDILDTPNGRLLKTLVDYGFVPGISSRGSGDVMDNNQVDPETFFLETWDIVQLPAVKKARLNVCESLDSESIKLKKALTESLNAAKEEDKDTMKKALENLNIDIEEEIADEESLAEALKLDGNLETQLKKLLGIYAEKISFEQTDKGVRLQTIINSQVPDKEKGHAEMIDLLKKNGYAIVDEVFQNNALTKQGMSFIDIDKESTTEALVEAPKKRLTADDIPWADDVDEVLVEEMPVDEEDSDEEKEEPATAEEPAEIEEVPEEEPAEEAEETSEKTIIDANEFDDIDDMETVGDAIELLQEFDDDVRVELEPLVIDGKEYELDGITSFVDDEGEEDILVLGVHCKDAEEISDDADSNIETETEEPAVETIEEVDDSEESAEDNGDEEVIESLKEMVRQKEALETEVKDLRKAKSVGDAKEQELQEKLNRYRTAFKNTSAEAAKVPELQAQVKELTEKLAQQSTTIKTLTEKVNKAQQLKESIEGSKANERRLNEEVSRLTEESKTLEAKLEGQTKTYTEKLQERTNLAKAYKARFIETLTRYVESKANMLGVQPSEITSRLNENYTLKDVDAVCDKILESTVNFGRLPFGGRAKTSARIAESVSRPKNNYEEDDLSDLYELAGLKK